MKTHLKTVKEVCELTGLKRKQLHDYDKMGILKPVAYENEAGYKLYDDASIRKLHQIVLWREIGMSRTVIRNLVNDSQHNHDSMLQEQIVMLENKRQHVEKQLVVAKYLQEIGVENISNIKGNTLEEILQEIGEKKISDIRGNTLDEILQEIQKTKEEQE